MARISRAQLFEEFAEHGYPPTVHIEEIFFWMSVLIYGSDDDRRDLAEWIAEEWPEVDTVSANWLLDAVARSFGPFQTALGFLQGWYSVEPDSQGVERLHVTPKGEAMLARADFFTSVFDDIQRLPERLADGE